jgi:hypothetical protein
VLQAASIGRGGEIFILNMANPFVSRKMAETDFLSGRERTQGRGNSLHGTRPGEKLLRGALVDERRRKPNTRTLRSRGPIPRDWPKLLHNINLFSNCLPNQERRNLPALERLVPEYQPSGLDSQQTGAVVPLRRIFFVIFHESTSFSAVILAAVSGTRLWAPLPAPTSPKLLQTLLWDAIPCFQQ